MSVFAFELRRRRNYPFEIFKFCVYFGFGFYCCFLLQSSSLPSENNKLPAEEEPHESFRSDQKSKEVSGKPSKPVTMYEVIPYDYFTQTHLYNSYYEEAKHGLLRHEKEDYKAVLDELLRNMNIKDESGVWTLKALKNGYRRVDPQLGEEYILDLLLFHSSNMQTKSSVYHVVKPFATIRESAEIGASSSTFVNIILPISSTIRLSRLKSFLKTFEDIARSDKAVNLIIVAMASSTKEESNLTFIKDAVTHLQRLFPHLKTKLQLVQSGELFSRGRALNLGVQAAPKSSVVFFCDVDVGISSEFFSRCRMNVETGHRVYYPMVFSFYNPEIVRKYSPQNKVQNLSEINKHTGHWVHYGYGMVCMYADDYFQVGGFNSSLRGWGGEDVDLYRKHVKYGYQIVRSMDPGLLHVFHPKVCDESLTGEQHQMCVQAAAEQLGSRQQLGRLVLEKDYH